MPLFTLSKRLSSTALLVAIAAATSLGQTPTSQANYEQAKKFNSDFLKQYVYGSAVSPKWIGKTEKFWYSYKTSEGTRYWLVDPQTKTKVPLFDCDLLAALLTEATEKARDADDLKISGLKLDKTGDKMTFSADKLDFEFIRSTGALTKKDKKKSEAGDDARERTRRGGTRGRRGGDGEDSEKKKEDENKERDRLYKAARKSYEEKKKNGGKKKEEEEDGLQSRFRRGRSTGSSAFSPDLKYYVFARDHQLYVIERSVDLPEYWGQEDEKPAVVKKDDGETIGGKEKVKEKENGAEKPAVVKTKPKKKREVVFPFAEAKAVKLTEDGEKDRGFGRSSRSRGGGDDEEEEKKNKGRRRPVTVSWAEDSSAFHVSRSDSRGVSELWLVDSLGKPRPKLQKYKYAMPGEEKVRHSELFVFKNGKNKLIRVKQKWTDESYSDVKWLKNGQLRMIRRDRLRRNLEYGIVDPETGDFRVLISEGFKEGLQVTQSVRYLEDRKEFIWWSERSGWGHYYLYSITGKAKNAITKGRYRASRIVAVDEEKGILWFRGNGREKGENVYYEHLYRVRLDGTGLMQLDPGNATHRSSVSKSRRFVVDNACRVDMPYETVLRDGAGNLVMELEKTDVSRIEEMGWRAPQPFSVKAADGFTNLYGNMWKPFDFDPKKSYPIIVHVYPGPQTEGVTHTFSATGSRQELAQLGFIVIQVGHRGGTPTRSKAYGAYGYFNMRDYGLADKKAAIEQLAARHPFIDVNRVGIYGHSGGGFMTAAALLKKPYNEFFKVGVSTAGNHDNNVYNSSWSERYHGLKEVEVKSKGKGKSKDDKKSDGKKSDGKKTDGKKTDGKKTDGKKTDGKKTDGKKTDGKKTKQEEKPKKKFQIKIPTNAELAANLKGKLLLMHGEIDNNVHPAGTMRLADALIRANKRFDLLIIPGARHGFGHARKYSTQRTWEYFAQHLLNDYQPGADINEKAPRRK